MRPIFSGIVGAVVGTLLLAALLRTVRPAARQTGSRSLLEYGAALRVMGVAALLLGGFLLYAAARSSENQRTLAWLVSGLSAGSALYVFLEVYFVRIEFNDVLICTFSPWRRARRIPWSDILSCHFSEVNRWYVIRTRSHGTLRVSVFLSGIGTFLDRVHDTTDG